MLTMPNPHDTPPPGGVTEFDLIPKDAAVVMCNVCYQQHRNQPDRWKLVDTYQACLVWAEEHRIEHYSEAAQDEQ